MRVSQVYRWQIPMDAGVVLRERRLKTRDGLFIRLQEGVNAKAGAKFLPAGIQCRDAGRGANGAVSVGTGLRDGAEPPLPTQPSVAFGNQLRAGGAWRRTTAGRGLSRGAALPGDPDELFARLAAMPGEKVAKVKVGLWEAVRDGMVVNLLLEAIPDLQLRLDANRAWTPLKAQQFAKYVNPEYRQRIAFLEEPCKTREDSRAFSRETGIAIAWDESLREADFRFVAEPGGTCGGDQT
ncbi:o-succinylbenzoate synthase [Klebsiella pneumoniae subsp. pneumoniae]|nr:o-succinylbenzoate synthase [Klebsiella pneumoniae subsp. pneumoniae]